MMNPIEANTMKSLQISLALLLATCLPGLQADPLEDEYNSQTGTAYTIVFDDSGSMASNNKIGQAKAAFSSWLANARPGNTWSYMPLNNKGLYLPFTKNGEKAVEERVMKTHPSGGTPIVYRLQNALRNIEKRRKEVTPYERHVLVLLSDGNETSHPRRNTGVQETVRQLRKANIEVYGIAFHGEGDYLDGHATHYFMANDRQQLQKGLASVGAEVPIDADFQITEHERTQMHAFAQKMYAKNDQGQVAVPGNEEVQEESSGVNSNLGLLGRIGAMEACCCLLMVLLIFFLVFRVLTSKKKD